MFLDQSTPTNAYRLETFRSLGPVSATASQQLRCYFVTKCNFSNQPASNRTDGKTDIRTVSDRVFLEKATENTLEIYQNIMWSVETRYGPVIEVFEVEGTRERRVVIGFKMNSTSHFLRFVQFPSNYTTADIELSVPCLIFTISTRCTPLENTSVCGIFTY
jgi:glutamate dehydrogenase